MPNSLDFNPWPYQAHIIRHVLACPFSGVFAEMGLGKTVCLLTAVDFELYQNFSSYKVLVVAPKRVALNVWTDEVNKWTHLRHLRLALVMGTALERVQALRSEADIHIINRDNIAWLQAHYQSRWPFTWVILDESSSFKHHKSKRFRALRMVRPLIKRLNLLSGTPAPNSLLDLWAPMYLLDQGERLYDGIEKMRARYFTRVPIGDGSFTRYEVHEEAKVAIYAKIGDLCISMKAEDYLTMPDLIQRDTYVTFSPGVQARYNNFKKEQIMLMLTAQGPGVEITAFSAGALNTKLMQFSGGAVYDEAGNYHVIHEEKLEALDEVLEEVGDQPCLVLYWFQHELDRLRKRYPHARVMSTRQDLLDWNAGKVLMMLGHPASMSHGLNLQAGGSVIIWYSQIWSSELFKQTIARLYRQGQLKPVMVFRLIVRGTKDENAIQVVDGKVDAQDELMRATRADVQEVLWELANKPL